MKKTLTKDFFKYFIILSIFCYSCSSSPPGLVGRNYDCQAFNGDSGFNITIAEGNQDDVDFLWAFMQLTNFEEWIGWGGWSNGYWECYCGYYGVDCISGRLYELALPNNNIRFKEGDPDFSKAVFLPGLKRVDLSGNLLDGNIPKELGIFTNLEYLDLSDNEFSGSIPPELGNLKNLRYLDLSGNNFTGQIPPEIWEIETLEYLDLGSNNFTGSIPPEIGGLNNLQHLDLNGNNFNFIIPPEMGGLPNLNYIDLSENNLSGKIPVEFANLSGLNILDLSSNSLSDTIPAGLGEESDFLKLDLSNNNLTGKIPEIPGGWFSLSELSLNNNKLSGTIPAEIGDLTELEVLQLNNNEFQCIHSNLQQLCSQDFEENPKIKNNPFELRWSGFCSLEDVPDEICACDYTDPQRQAEYEALVDIYDFNRDNFLSQEWKELRVGSNCDICELPEVVCNADGYVIELDIENKNLDFLPESIGNLINLQSLLVENNDIRCLPAELLDLCANNLSTSFAGNPIAALYADMAEFCSISPDSKTCVPCEISTFEKVADYNSLVALYESTNGDNWINKGTNVDPDIGYEGWLNDCDYCSWYGVTCDLTGRVVYLSLPDNGLTGFLDNDITFMSELETLDLSRNQVSGSIPFVIGNLFNLSVLNLRGNLFNGKIPKTVGNLTNLNEIHLSDNLLLNDTIPFELGELEELKVIELSNNRFTGPVPQGFWTNDQLETLNLSFNELSGSIPSELGNLSNLSALFLNDNKFACIHKNVQNLCSNLWSFDVNNPNISSNPFGLDWQSLCRLEEPLPDEICKLECNEITPVTITSPLVVCKDSPFDIELENAQLGVVYELTIDGEGTGRFINGNLGASQIFGGEYTQSGNYGVVIYYINNQSKSCSGDLISNEIDISVEEITATISGNLEVCAGSFETTELTAGGGDFFRWETKTGILLSLEQTYVTGAGTFNLIVFESSNGCTDEKEFKVGFKPDFDNDGQCDDADLDDDNDGVNDDDDCAPFDPTLPSIPGTACDDGDPNTSNDQVTSDGCGCQGTNSTDPCASLGGDSDNDGTCDNDDCQPDNASFPAMPGTSCDDGNANTNNDQVTSDGCGCQGTPINTGPDCDTDVSISTGLGTLIIGGLDVAPISQLQVFNTATWNKVFNCAGNCTPTETLSLNDGNYYVSVKYFTSSWDLICERTEELAVVGVLAGGDSDGDGISDDDDCQPNNAAFPATPGTPCDDGDPNTVSDVITSDGCGCAGSVVVGGVLNCETDVSVLAGNGTINISGYDVAPVSSIKVFSSTWNIVFSCFNDCETSQSIPVSEGAYFISVKFYTEDYEPICKKETTLTVGSNSSCNNVLNAGQIGFSSVCENTNLHCPDAGSAPLILDCGSPFGGVGDLEIVWLKSTSSCSYPTSSAAQIEQGLDPHWKVIPNENSMTYAPGAVSVPTCYLRCARRSGCTEYIESNIISLDIDPSCGGGSAPDCSNITIGTSAGQVNVSGLDGAPISSVEIFNSDWMKIISCLADCNPSGEFIVPSGTYNVHVKYYDSDYLKICSKKEEVTVPLALIADNDLFEFEVAKQLEHTELFWLQKSGVEVFEYIVERSSDGLQFESIDRMAADKTGQLETYHSFDLSPQKGQNHYRIRALSQDEETIEFSDVKVVEFKDYLDFLLFPNPSNGIAMMNMERLDGYEKISISIVNNLGVQVKQFQLDRMESQYYQLDLRELKDGMYFVQVQAAGFKQQTKRMVIAKAN